MSNKSIAVYSKALDQQPKSDTASLERKIKATSKPTSPRDKSRDNPRDKSRDIPRDNTRDNPRDIPTRDEVQEFSFSLRDELNVKVQAEVPYTWQKELDNMARDLDVKKLELYRYILGEFLGKVERRNSD